MHWALGSIGVGILWGNAFELNNGQRTLVYNMHLGNYMIFLKLSKYYIYLPKAGKATL